MDHKKSELERSNSFDSIDNTETQSSIAERHFSRKNDKSMNDLDIKNKKYGYWKSEQEALSGDSRELKKKIAETRAHIDESTNDALSMLDLTDTRNITNIIGQLPFFNGDRTDWRQIKDNASRATSSYFEKHSLSTALLMGLGVIWYYEKQGKMPSAGQTVRWTAAKTKSAGDGIARQTRNASDWSSRKTRQLGDWSSRKIEGAKEKVIAGKEKIKAKTSRTGQAYHTGYDSSSNFNAKEKTLRLVDGVQDQVQQSYRTHPLAFGLGVVGLGMLFGSYLPVSRKERELIKPQVEKVKGKLDRKASAAVEKVRKRANDGFDEAEAHLSEDNRQRSVN